MKSVQCNKRMTTQNLCLMINYMKLLMNFLSNFIFDSVQLLYYKCHKINFNNGVPYIDSPDCIKHMKAKINLKNKDGKCLQYAVTVPLNYRQIKCNPKRVSNIEPFINKHNWDGIKYPSKIEDWKDV